MSLKKEFIKICHMVYEKGFVAATDGNLSQRINYNQALITPSGKNKGELNEDDLLVIDLDGNLIEGKGKISTEVKMHLLAYNSRRDINAVVHAHPVYATAFAAAGRDLTDPVFPEVILTLGKVHLCEYGTPSTEELILPIKKFIDKAWALLLQNHGAVTFGVSLKDAYYKMEKLEHAAKTIFIAEQLGGAKKIPPEKVKQLLSIARSTYGIHPNFELEADENIKLPGVNDEPLYNNEVSYSQIIEDRLRARAGNLNVNPFDVKGRNSISNENRSNLSKSEIDEIIKEFNYKKD